MNSNIFPLLSPKLSLFILSFELIFKKTHLCLILYLPLKNKMKQTNKRKTGRFHSLGSGFLLHPISRICTSYVSIFLPSLFSFFFFLNLFLYFYMMQLYLAKYFIAPGAFKVNSTEKTLCLFHILFLFVFFPWRGNLPPFHVEQEHNLCSWSPNHFFYQLLI